MQWEKGERGGTTLLPDDPPAIQELMNDLNGFTLLQGHLILQHRSVGFDGDVGLTWRGRGILQRSTQHVAPHPSPPLWAWGFLQLELRTPSAPVLPTPPGDTLDFYPLPALLRGARPLPPTAIHTGGRELP